MARSKFWPSRPNPDQSIITSTSVEKMKTAFAFAFLIFAAGVPTHAQQLQKPAARHQTAHHPHSSNQPHPAALNSSHAPPEISQSLPSPAAASLSPSPAAPASPSAPPISVAYELGSLSITAENAPLREILNQIHNATGAALEAPALDQRITLRLRPQPPSQAIASLVEGLPLNYALLGGTTERDPLRRIIITSQSPEAPVPAAVLEAQAAAARSLSQRFIAETGGDEGVWENAPAPPPPPPAKPALSPN
jgi:hypothetical protein